MADSKYNYTLGLSPREDEALHYSEGKAGVEQIPAECLLDWGRVFSYGEKKYARDNWLSGTKWSEFLGSALRHLLYWKMGEDLDPESGLPHLAHALWNIGALHYYQSHSLGEDNRDPLSRRLQGETWASPNFSPPA